MDELLLRSIKTVEAVMPGPEAPYVHSPEVKVAPCRLLCARYCEVHKGRINDGRRFGGSQASASAVGVEV